MKSGLAGGVDVHFDYARRMARVELDRRCAQTQALEALRCGTSKLIIADAAGDDAGIAQQICHIGEVGGCSAELLAFREHVPEEFAQANDGESFCGGHVPISLYFQIEPNFQIVSDGIRESPESENISNPSLPGEG